MIVQGSGLSNAGVNRVLERALDAAALREQVLANNIANIDTPGFKRSDVDFNAALRQAIEQDLPPGIQIRRTKERHIVMPRPLGAGPRARRETSYVQRNDENNTSIEAENASRDQNQLLYSLAAQLYGDRLKWLAVVLDARR